MIKDWVRVVFANAAVLMLAGAVLLLTTGISGGAVSFFLFCVFMAFLNIMLAPMFWRNQRRLRTVGALLSALLAVLTGLALLAIAAEEMIPDWLMQP